MDTTASQTGESLLKAEVTRRGTIKAAAWSLPVVAVAAATPAAVASPPIDPTTDLEVGATGGSEGFYSTKSNANLSQTTPSNTTDFRRGFWVKNKGSATFTGTLRIAFQFPRKWNEATGGDVDAFNNWSTRDFGGSGGASIGGASDWTVTPGSWVPNTAPSNINVWTAVWFRMDNAYFDLTNVVLPADGVIWFAINAGIPPKWINATGNTGGGTYIWVNSSSQVQVSAPGSGIFNGFIYWKSGVDITATTTGGTNLGTWNTGVGDWPNAIWYFNGGGPFNYGPGSAGPGLPATAGGLYPAYGVG